MDKENISGSGFSKMFWFCYLYPCNYLEVCCFSDADNSCLVKAEPSLSKPVTGTPPSSVPSPGTAQSAVTEKEGMTDVLLVSHTVVAERLPAVVAGKLVLIPQNGVIPSFSV